MGEIINMPTPRHLTPEQRAHWLQQLEAAERQVEVARRMLGMLAIEKGMEE